MRICLGLMTLLVIVTPVSSQDGAVPRLGPYEYEVVPKQEAFKAFHPRKAPTFDGKLIKKGDRLAICGDSITEQKMYSRIIETYLTVCTPELQIRVRQYGWSGEKTDGFLRRMRNDCLRFDPTIATLAYGMNDSRYRPFDANNGRWFADHLRAIIREFKGADVRVVVGSPGCAGKIAKWVKSRHGTLEQHNVHLCALRDIGIGVAAEEDVRYADIFWPMIQAQVLAPSKHGATEENPYEVAGADGIHPGWAGHVIMAWAFLRGLGLDGNLGTIDVDLNSHTATASSGHAVVSFTGRKIKMKSQRYPFCAEGDENADDSVRSGTTLVPFHKDLNRFILRCSNLNAERYKVVWGTISREFSADELRQGINLPKEFHSTPFDAAFRKVDKAVAEKQAYETTQIKREFRSRLAKQDIDSVVQSTEAKRSKLVQAIQSSFEPVTHVIEIEATR